MKPYRLLLILAVTCYGNLCYAQTKKELRFEHLTESDGLSSNSVTGIFRDSRGFMWFGTQDGGLNRYDGNHLKIFRHDSTNSNSLGGDFVTGVMEAKDGMIWIGNFDQGISVLDPVTEIFTHYRHDSTDALSLPKGIVNAIHQDRKGRIWVAIYGGGLNLIDPISRKVTSFQHDEKDANSISTNSLKDIKEDNNGFLWFSTWDVRNKNCIQKFDPETKKFICIPVSNLYDYRDTTQVVANDNWISVMNRVYVDSRQDIWFGTYVGLFRYSQSLNKFYTYVVTEKDPNSITFNNIRGICEDEEGNLLLSTLGGGLNYYNRQTKTFTSFEYQYNNSHSISDNELRGIYKDKEGRIWIGSFRGGISIINPVKQGFSLITGDLLKATHRDRSAGNLILHVGISDEQLITSSGSGMGFYNVRTGFSETFRLNKENQTEGFYRRLDNFSQSSDGRILVTTGNAVIYLDPVTHATSKPDLDPKGRGLGVFYEQEPDKIWITAGASPLVIYSPSAHTFTNIPGDTTTVDAHNIFPDKKGNVIVTTFHKGITIFNADGSLKKYYPVYKEGDKTHLDDIAASFCDATNNIWISDGNGFQLFDQATGKTSYPGKLAQLASKIAVGINQDKKGNLWIVYPDEIVRFSYAEGSLLHFGKEMGLGAHEMLRQNIPFMTDGTFFIRSIEGVVVLKTQDINPSLAPPKLTISGIKLFNKTFETDTAIYYKKLLALNYDQNSLEFEYSAFDYTNPKQVNYFYRLEGVDTGWTDAGNRGEVSFTNLDPGYYTLHIKCVNSFGISNVEPCAIHILITPPFWRTTWFYILVIVVIVLIIYSYIKYRESRLLKEKNKLEEQVTQRTAEVVMQKEIIEQKNKEVTDSIHYAQKIQAAILPSNELLDSMLGDHFIVFKPKDIVSGDFYWVTETEKDVFFATVDCTGHGVPGGFMCMLGSSLLTEIVENTHEPAEVLNLMRDKIIQSLKQTGATGENRDGMDMMLCRLDKKKQKLTYAAANNSLYLVRKCELHEYKADKMPISFYTGQPAPFSQHTIELQKGDMIYTFTDGYADQFGGPKGKKFKYSQFEQLLVNVSTLPVKEQQAALDNAFESWRGELEQVDDVLVTGVRI